MVFRSQRVRLQSSTSEQPNGERSRGERQLIRALVGMGSVVMFALLAATPTLAQELIGVHGLPPVEDIPEEILRTEIILDARSPVDGEPLTASEYVELQQELAEPEYAPTLNSETRQLIFLLQIRKVLNIVSPFQVL